MPTDGTQSAVTILQESRANTTDTVSGAVIDAIVAFIQAYQASPQQAQYLVRGALLAFDLSETTTDNVLKGQLRLAVQCLA
jgi:hypothetical protein